MAARTVGELVEILSKFPKDMPLWLTASCYTHDHRVFTQIKPASYALCDSKKLDDGTEVDTYRGVGVSVSEEEHESRSVKKNGKWKHEYAKYLRIENDDSDDYELYD